MNKTDNKIIGHSHVSFDSSGNMNVPGDLTINNNTGQVFITDNDGKPVMLNDYSNTHQIPWWTKHESTTTNFTPEDQIKSIEKTLEHALELVSNCQKTLQELKNGRQSQMIKKRSIFNDKKEGTK